MPCRQFISWHDNTSARLQYCVFLQMTIAFDIIKYLQHSFMSFSSQRQQGKSSLCIQHTDALCVLCDYENSIVYNYSDGCVAGVLLDLSDMFSRGFYLSTSHRADSGFAPNHWVSEWVIEFNGLSQTANSEVHIVHISRVIIACTLKSLSPPT